MTLDQTSFAAALKEIYTKERVLNLMYSQSPLLAMLPKSADFEGTTKRFVITYGSAQGRSATFSNAQSRSAATSLKVAAYSLSRAKNYQLLNIDSETIMASKSDAGAFMEAITASIDAGFKNLSADLSHGIYRDGYGVRGIINSTVAAATTITLSEQADVCAFEVGQELVVASGGSAGAVRTVGSSTNGLIVTSVDRSSGVLGFGFAIDDAANGIPTIANGDRLFVRGDRDVSASPARLKIAGLAAYVPDTQFGVSDTLFGCPVGVDSRLGGLRFSANQGQPVDEALIDALALAEANGAEVTHCFVHPKTYSSLSKALGSRVQYIDIQSNTAAISFKAMELQSGTMTVKILADLWCPVSKVWLLNVPTWNLSTLGDLTHFIEDDGLEGIRVSNADQYEIRIRSMANLAPRAPGHNVNVILA